MEVGAALDTNRLTDLLMGDGELQTRIENAERVFLPFIVIGEVKYGFLGGTRSAHNEALLLRLLQRPGVATLYADGGTLDLYARLRLQLKKAGTPIPANDIWIAALVLQHNLRLYTRDRHFTMIPQLMLE